MVFNSETNLKLDPSKNAEKIRSISQQVNGKSEEQSEAIDSLREEMKVIKRQIKRQKDENKAFQSTYNQELKNIRRLNRTAREATYKIGGVFSVFFTILSLVFTLVVTLITFISNSKNNVSFDIIAKTLGIIAGIMGGFTILGIIVISFIISKWSKSNNKIQR